MRIGSTLLTLVWIVSLVSVVAAQEQPLASSASGALDAKDLVLRYYQPKSVDAESLAETTWNIAGRLLEIRTDGVLRSARNVHAFAGAVVLYDSRPRAAELEDLVKTLDAAATREEAPRRLTNLQYQPRFISLGDLDSALVPFRRLLHDGGSGAVPNVTLLQERGMVLVREEEQRATEIRNLLQGLDVAKPQVVVTCQVIEGVTRDKTSTHLPEELVENLSRLLPFEGFRLLGTGVIRTAAPGSGPVKMDMALGEGRVEARFAFMPGPFDATTQSLLLDRIQFDIVQTVEGAQPTRRSFQTTTTVPVGEYTVLGAFGGSPLFVVVRVIVS